MDPTAVAELVAKSIVSVKRIVRLPVAAANRPVPPVIVAVSETLDTLGGTNSFSPPAVLVQSSSPFAAVKLYVPVLVLFIVFTRFLRPR